jgi:hypothetical protein
MYIDLVCGPCESSLALDTADEDVETLTLDLIHRFTKAHEPCGYILPSVSETPNLTNLQPRNLDEKD